MKVRIVLPLAAALALNAGGAARGASFELGLQGCPSGVVEGRVGEVKTFNITCTLEIRDNDSLFDGQDGALDLSDAVSLLGTLFLGTPERLPCGDGSTTDPGNVELLDWQADGAVDISDVIAVLQFLFLDGPPHALAPEDPALGGCVTLEECSSRATCP